MRSRRWLYRGGGTVEVEEKGDFSFEASGGLAELDADSAGVDVDQLWAALPRQ